MLKSNVDGIQGGREVDLTAGLIKQWATALAGLLGSHDFQAMLAFLRKHALAVFCSAPLMRAVEAGRCPLLLWTKHLSILESTERNNSLAPKTLEQAEKGRSRDMSCRRLSLWDSGRVRNQEVLIGRAVFAPGAKRERGAFHQASLKSTSPGLDQVHGLQRVQ